MSHSEVARLAQVAVRHGLGALGLAAALLLATSCESVRPQPYNVVLISLDTLRVDRMSLYGGPRPTTPSIDALANHAVRFDQAYSPSPWTLPAHAALLTGRYPSSVSSNFSDHLYRLAPLLSTILKSHGYRTAAVTGGGFVSKAYGADIGFDRFEQRNWNLDNSRGSPRSSNLENALQWVETGSGPFFLFFHTYAAHLPYTDRRFVTDGEGERLAEIYKGPMTAWMNTNLRLNCGWIDLTDTERQFLLALYDGGVAAADEMVAEVLATLRRTGLFERTIIIITSDHGEEFWDHTNRAAFHGHTLYNELLRVPLLWYEPNLANPGSSRAELVSLVDVVPTVLARLGITAPSSLDGVDLSPLLDSKEWLFANRTLFGEAVMHGPPRQGAISPGGTLILTPDPEIQHGEGVLCSVPVLDQHELYLPGDAAQRRNLFAEQPALVETLAAELRAQTASAPPAPPQVTRPPLDEETKERLRALGYRE